jgi:hypothetical protein
MSSLPGQLDFAGTEEEICERWKNEKTFQTQNKLSLERGDEVSFVAVVLYCSTTVVVCVYELAG